VPYRAHNAKIESARELLQVKGITPALFYGTDTQPGLVEDLTAKSSSPRVNVNTAGERVLCALGLAPAQIGLIEQTRNERPLKPQDVGAFGQSVAGLSSTSQTFRVRAEGMINGRRGARVTAVLRRGPAQGSSGPPGVGVSVVEWSVDR
jgi:hypothetical protein